MKLITGPLSMFGTKARIATLECFIRHTRRKVQVRA